MINMMSKHIYPVIHNIPVISAINDINAINVIDDIDDIDDKDAIDESSDTSNTADSPPLNAQWLLSVLRGIAAWPDPWIDLKRACIMKGIAYNSLKGATNYWKRPNNGVPDGIVNGRDMWRPETIKHWITQTDDDLKQSAREGGMYDTDK